MAILKTNYVDDILNVTVNEDRIYDIKDQNGNVIESNVALVEKSKYLVEGDTFSADDINATNTQVNQNTADIEELKACGGTDGNGIIEVTQAEWDAMSEEERNNGAYFIPDAPRGVSVGEVKDSVDGAWRAISEANRNLTAFDVDTQEYTEDVFRYAMQDGKDGRILKVNGADTFVPFKSGGELKQYVLNANGSEANYIARINDNITAISDGIVILAVSHNNHSSNLTIVSNVKVNGVQQSIVASKDVASGLNQRLKLYSFLVKENDVISIEISSNSTANRHGCQYTFSLIG